MADPTPETPTPDPAPAAAAPAPAPAAAAPGAESPAAKALKAAQEAIARAKAGQIDAGDAPESAPASTGGQSAQPFAAPSFAPNVAPKSAEGIDLLGDVNLQVKIELGRTRMLVEDVLRLSEGSVVELDKLAGDPVDVYVNDRPVARGEVLVLNDNFCVRISEITGSANPAV
jgi:flagellar motor switch protein FliN/FliY